MYYREIGTKSGYKISAKRRSLIVRCCLLFGLCQTRHALALCLRTTQIEGVHTVNIYENVTPRPNRHDLMIEMEMDQEALPVYDASATHQEWKARYGKYIQTKTIFDYE